MLTDQDKAKFNELYLAIKSIPIPTFKDEEAQQMAVKVKEGLGIINKAILKVSKLIP